MCIWRAVIVKSTSETFLCRLKRYHLEAFKEFEAYKQFYTDQVVPLLAEQKEVEAAMLELEPKAALDAEVM